MSTATEILAAIRSAPADTVYFGLRVEDGRTFAIGDYIPNSRVWDDGEPTQDEVDGVSTVGLGDDPSLSDVETALGAADIYHGATIMLVGARYQSRGQDAGEHVLRRPISLGVWTREAKAARTIRKVGG
jgi:hypothetical protein